MISLYIPCVLVTSFLQQQQILTEIRNRDANGRNGEDGSCHIKFFAFNQHLCSVFPSKNTQSFTSNITIQLNIKALDNTLTTQNPSLHPIENRCQTRLSLTDSNLDKSELFTTLISHNQEHKLTKKLQHHIPQLSKRNP